MKLKSRIMHKGTRGIRLQKKRNASMWLSAKLGTGWNALLAPYTDGLEE